MLERLRARVSGADLPPDTGPWPSVPPVLLGVGFTLIYALAVFVGRLSRLPGTSLALVWPAAAVGFAWMLWASFRGRRFLLLNALLLAAVAAIRREREYTALMLERQRFQDLAATLSATPHGFPDR